MDELRYFHNVDLELQYSTTIEVKKLKLRNGKKNAGGWTKENQNYLKPFQLGNTNHTYGIPNRARTLSELCGTGRNPFFSTRLSLLLCKIAFLMWNYSPNLTQHFQFVSHCLNAMILWIQSLLGLTHTRICHHHCLLIHPLYHTHNKNQQQNGGFSFLWGIAHPQSFLQNLTLKHCPHP